jgi:hypothetical protein
MDSSDLYEQRKVVYLIAQMNIYKENSFIRHAAKMTCKQGSANSCDDGMLHE